MPLSSESIQHLDALKGQMGRVAVIGGSEDYTGAPYFSAMASARLGADMVGSLHSLFTYTAQQLTVQFRVM